MVDSKKFGVKMLISMIAYASGQLAELEDSFKKKLAGIDSVIQWKVADINSYTIVKDQKIESKMDAVHDSPTYTITIKDLDTALGMFQGKIDMAQAIADGKIEVQGDAEAVQKQAFIMEDLAGYLGDLTGGGG
ncbi:MAG: SCP2 sterol-binding domain-containing protein [Candidatus Helarchaeota archaeon]|nr:SCP2 sterol-binding domain-containing protein [Candidatus Helarchaeota archaeon]